MTKLEVLKYASNPIIKYVNNYRIEKSRFSLISGGYTNSFTLDYGFMPEEICYFEMKINFNEKTHPQH